MPSRRNNLKIYWLFPVVVFVHNMEEAIWMPRFWRSHAWHPIHVTEFRALAFAVALLAFAVTYAATRERRKFAIYAFAAFCAIMLLNALWHIGVTIYLRTYAPGVVTAIFLVLPISAYLLLSFKRGLISTTPED